jgi:hypothetical protein
MISLSAARARIDGHLERLESETPDLLNLFRLSSVIISFVTSPDGYIAPYLPPLSWGTSLTRFTSNHHDSTNRFGFF